MPAILRGYVRIIDRIADVVGVVAMYLIFLMVGVLLLDAVTRNVIDIPLHGRIAAGAPIEALEDHQSLPVPAALLGPGEHFALEVSGDSMIEAGIFDGDYALIRRADSARDGDIVVALVDNEEATLKYLWREGGRVRLDPANASYEPQVYDARSVQVQGKLAGLLRRYH